MNCTIFAPHVDDEIIGCWSVFQNFKNIQIVYPFSMHELRRREALQIPKYFGSQNIKIIFTRLEKCEEYLSSLNFFPHPIYETHPQHRLLAIRAERLWRLQGVSVIFYSTEMNVPWKIEVKDSTQKRIALDSLFPSQKSLWKYEHKYVLFEAYDSWLNYNIENLKGVEK